MKFFYNVLLIFLFMSNVNLCSEKEAFENFKDQLLEKTTSEDQRNNLGQLLKNIFPEYHNVSLLFFTKGSSEYFEGRIQNYYNMEELFDGKSEIGAYFQKLLLFASLSDISLTQQYFFINPKDIVVDYNNFSSLAEFFLERGIYPEKKDSTEYRCLRSFLANIAALEFLCPTKRFSKEPSIEDAVVSIIFIPITLPLVILKNELNFHNEFRKYLVKLSKFAKRKRLDISIALLLGLSDSEKRCEQLDQELHVLSVEIASLQENVRNNVNNADLFRTIMDEFSTKIYQQERIKHRLGQAQFKLKKNRKEFADVKVSGEYFLYKFPLVIEMITDGTVRYFADQEIRKKQSFFFKRVYLNIASYFSDDPLIKMAKWWKDLIGQLPSDNICLPGLKKAYEEYFGRSDKESQRNSTFEKSLHEWLGNNGFTYQEIEAMIISFRKNLDKK